MFKLKRPCKRCPFRKDMGHTYLFSRDRVREIVTGTAFQCHATVDYSEDWQGQPGDTPQQCAGLMAVLHRSGRPNQIMQVAIRTGHLDPATLDPDGEAYDSIKDAMAAFRRGPFGRRRLPDAG